MAEDSPSVDDATLPDHVLSIGWHLLQGMELSGYYASLAEGTDEEKWVPFFRDLEVGYRNLLDEAGAKLPPSIARKGRPPY